MSIKSIVTCEFTIGTSIFGCGESSIKLAKKLNCVVKFSFNDIVFYVSEENTPNEVESRYYECIKNKDKLCILL